MFIKRNYIRTVHDDFVLNVQPCLGINQEAVAIYNYTTNQVLGWNIQNKYD